MINWLKYVILALTIQGFVIFFVKIFSSTVNPVLILFFQYIGSFISVCFYLLLKRIKPKVNKRELLLAVLSGLLLSTGLSFYYLSISLANVSIVSSLQSIGITIIPVILGLFVLKEKLTKRLVIGLVCAFLGIIFLTI